MIEVFKRKLVTPRQVAESGLMSLVKQWQLRKAGKLEYVKVGSRIFYSEEILNRFLENSTVATQTVEHAVAAGG